MMKNKLFLAVLASLSLAACSNDDVVSTQTSDNDVLRFRTAVTNSRGSVTDITAIEKTGFWVKAIQTGTINKQWAPANGMYKFDKQTDGSYQVTDPNDDEEFDLRWPVDQSLDFYATNINPDNNTLVGPTVGVNPKYNAFKPAEKIADQIDFVYASNQGNRIYFPNTVPLKFKHALSQIEIKAKCGSTKYTVKVKGYRIGYVSESGTFTYGDVKTINSPTVPTSQNEEPNAGSWSDLSANHVNYSSEFWGGDGYKTGVYNGYFDNNENNYYLLDSDPVTIVGDGNEGFVMAVPQYGDAYVPSAKGAFLALLVQIDYKPDADGNVKALYPAPNRNDETKRIAYAGLPKCYGYVATPVIYNWEAGKKYTYILDLTDAAGYVDPEKPDVVDPDDPDKPGKEDDDPYNKEDEVLGHAIKFSVEVSEWDVTPGNKDVPM
jgi:hypothetical protein